MDTYIIDFETAFSSENTLSKCSIEEYVRSPKFEVIGLGVQDMEGRTEWKTGQRIRDFFLVAEKQEAAVICHHAQFDRFIAQPRLWLQACLLSMTLSL